MNDSFTVRHIVHNSIENISEISQIDSFTTNILSTKNQMKDSLMKNFIEDDINSKAVAKREDNKMVRPELVEY